MKQTLQLCENDFMIKDNDIFWNTRKTDSYNCTFNCSIGGRGIGKTTGALNKALHRFANNDEQFVYMRRYKPEIRAFKTKDPIKKIVNGVSYKGDGAGGLLINYGSKTMGYAIPLAVGIANKSANFDKVTTIIFDEFTLKRGQAYRYLYDEATAFWETIGTIVRLRKNYKIYLLGNNTDLFNPYSSFFDLPLIQDKYYDNKRGIYWEYPKNNPKLVELEKETPLYKLISGTTYGDYYYDNKLLINTNVSTMSKPSNCRLFIKLIVNEDTLNVYFYEDKGTTKLFIDRRHKKNIDNISYVILESGNINKYYSKMFIQRFSTYLSRFYYNNIVSYDDDKTGAIFSWIMTSIK